MKIYYQRWGNCHHYVNGVYLYGPCEFLIDSNGAVLTQNCDLACDRDYRASSKEEKEIEVSDLPLYMYMCYKNTLFDDYLKGKCLVNSTE